MEHTSFRFIYHDELTHYDKEAWLEVGDFAGWAVVECNCKLETSTIGKLIDLEDDSNGT